MTAVEPMAAEFRIEQERPDTSGAAALIEELDAHLIPLYPPESHHGLSVSQLIAENAAFYVARLSGTPVACGALLFAGDEYVEIKRMFVLPGFRGMGFGKAMLGNRAIGKT